MQTNYKTFWWLEMCGQRLTFNSPLIAKYRLPSTGTPSLIEVGDGDSRPIG